MVIFTDHDGAIIKRKGERCCRKSDYIFLLRQTQEFSLLLGDGRIVRGDPGDYLAYDPLLDEVWIVLAHEAAQYYDTEENRFAESTEQT